MVVLTPAVLRSNHDHQSTAATDKPSSTENRYTHAEVSFLAGTYMVANAADRTSVSKPERLSAGYQVCSSLKRGITQGDVIDSLRGRYDFADLLVTAADENLCPENLTS
jgi:hypothetical protein